MLKFQHTVVYRTLGIGLPSGESDKELLVNTQAGLHVVVTREPDQYCFHSDQSLAAAHLLMTGGFSADTASFTQRLEAQVAEIRDARCAKHTSGLYLVFERQGTADTYSPDVQREVEQFVISLDGFDGDDIRNKSQVQFARLILALSIATERPIGTEKVGDSITLFRSDGKPIYPRTLSVGEPTVWVSTPSESLESTQRWLRAIECHPELDRIYQLFASSIELQDDRLRSFLTAWAALEIFLNKVFKQYEQHLFQELSNVRQPEVRNRCLKRIQEVMKDKYRLSDRFFVISATLDPANADADYTEFQAAKDI